MKKNIHLLAVILLFVSCQIKDKDISTTEVVAYTPKHETEVQIYTEEQQEIIDKYVYNCADQYSYKFYHHEYQECLNKGIKEDPNISYLWQQKAMPYFKARKYEVGMRYLDKAVEINKVRYLSYRGFIKCIFAKTYKEAIADFEEIKSIEGNSIEMDHSYDFYIALSHLQLNNFITAEEIFTQDVNTQVEEWGEKEYHHLSIFYLAISQYEQKKWEEANKNFDKTLEKYPTFSEALYYKSICLMNLNQNEKGMVAYEKAKINGQKGNTINEDNSLYEPYPYKILWN